MMRIVEVHYAIRHKATGFLMPQMKKDRGYSHWNPDKPKELHASLGVPRLLQSRRQAVKCISGWAAFPNSKGGGHYSYDGEWIEDIDMKDDGRKKEDLEVIEVYICIQTES